MDYINFVILTDTPARLRNFLINRGVMQEVTDPSDGTVSLVGTRPGMEWVKVPNPIETAPGNTAADPIVPPTYDTRPVFLVKFAHDSVDNEVEGPTQEANGQPIDQYNWSKFGKWVMTNSTVVNAPANFMIQGEHAGEARKINGELVWLIKDRPERFGTWQ